MENDERYPSIHLFVKYTKFEMLIHQYTQSMFTKNMNRCHIQTNMPQKRNMPTITFMW